MQEVKFVCCLRWCAGEDVEALKSVLKERAAFLVEHKIFYVFRSEM